MRLKDLIKLLRVQQWYKNLVIFLPLIFTIEFFHLDKLSLTLLGCISLCLISSANYIINDIIDRKRDKIHSEKMDRPIASGKIKIWQALIMLAPLLLLSLIIAYTLSTYFLYSVIALFILTQLYTFYFKKEAFADILFIGVNFVIRAVSGTFIINSAVSPWLVLCTFFLSLFLSAGKREADIILLGEKAGIHKESLGSYSKSMTNALMILATSLLIISYSLYSFLSTHKLLLTLPFAMYSTFRYFCLVYSGSEIARRPEKAFKDARLMISSILWLLAVFALIY